MGRHSAPDDYDDDAAAVLSAPPAAANRPLPGRHSHGTSGPSGEDSPASATGPVGLDVIETVMAGDTEVADPGADPAAGPAAADRTEQIEPIVDPVLDEPLPAAVTTVIAPVIDGPAPRPAPHPQPGHPAVDDLPAGPTEGHDGASVDVPADASAAKAANAKAKAEAKAAARAAKAERAAAKAEAKAAGKATQGPSAGPDARVSDLALLRADSAARARVVAAIVVPFLLYVGVLLVLGEFDPRTMLIWIWVPLISAGVVAGLLLDLAHRAAAARAIAALERPREPEPTDLS